MILRLLRSLFCIAGFAVAFGLTCGFIHDALPFPQVHLVENKLAQLREHGDEYDTLFLGSSRLHYQVIPAIFDRITAEKGQATQSFNGAVAGMRPPEDAYFLDQILENPPHKLRWVFIELAGIRLNLGEDKKGTIRGQYWHDWDRMKVLFQRAMYLKPKKKRSLKDTWKELQEPMGEFFEHLELFAKHQTNLGQASFLTTWLMNGPQPPRGPLNTPQVLGDDLRGWTRTGRPDEMTPANKADYDHELAERKKKPAEKDLGDPVSQAALEDMLAKIEKLGATPVLIVPPTTNKRNFYPLPEREAKTLVLDFCDLNQYPELFEDRHRLDTDHVNTPGAEVFTRILAERWLEAQAKRR